MKRFLANFKIFLFFIFLTCCSKRGGIDFYQEKIIIEIDSLSAFVTGHYFFCNYYKTNKIVKFFYPFPIDVNHPFPDIIILDLPYERDTNGIHFSMLVKPGSDNSFKISYRQKLRKRFFRYITTTTRKWGRPIKYAEFIIYLPEEYQPKINYKVNKIELQNGRRCYKIIKRGFYPFEDLIIEW
jgi:hypothetical protein|uniref:Uncharacterized protein n=1 Tax=candidate division WOR-3 bacterium TaxID=2052148 RepID=A0A7V3RG02_UNCW3